jgi:hypothetical protein
MLLSFHNHQPNNSVKESKLNTVSPEVLENDEWMETPDDVVTVCTNENITHQQRYEYRKNRKYSKHKPKKD